MLRVGFQELLLLLICVAPPVLAIGALLVFLVRRGRPLSTAQAPTPATTACPRCGQIVPSGVRFCGACGAPIGD